MGPKLIGLIFLAFVVLAIWQRRKPKSQEETMSEILERQNREKIYNPNENDWGK